MHINILDLIVHMTPHLYKSYLHRRWLDAIPKISTPRHHFMPTKFIADTVYKIIYDQSMIESRKSKYPICNVASHSNG